MSKYEVCYYDSETGASSPIDVIDAPDGYTSDDYCSMLLRGSVQLYPVDEEV